MTTPDRTSSAAQGQDKRTLSEAWLSAVIKRLLREHGGTLRKLADDA